MPRVLIVAFGNPLRSDDGVAWRAADALEAKRPGAEVEILRVHQLAPEVAETIRHFNAVIFVDAAEGVGVAGEVRCQDVSPSADYARYSHHLSPGAVVALTRDLYGAGPRAFSVTLTGESFEHGEALSPVVVAALPALIARIDALAQLLRKPDHPSASKSMPVETPGVSACPPESGIPAQRLEPPGKP